MKKVKIFKWVRIPDKSSWHKIEDGEGVFIQYGVDFQEFENGIGNFSTAIIELDDGSVKNIPADLIQFIK